jgi:hypothetical protein
MRRPTVLAISSFIAALALLGVAVSSAAGSGPARQATPDAKMRERSLGVELQKAERVAPARISQRLATRKQVRRLTNRLNRLTRAHNDLARAHNQLVNTVANCFGIAPVTQYFGYWYGSSGAEVTALDFTDPGDPVSALMSTWRC